MKSQEIRDRFSQFFEKAGHQKHTSSPLIPINDDSLLFANAGMNQFKEFFTGKAHPQNKRAVTIQKCVRAGGKHNDLENVGFTARHHTFFEMLGNFSFGDYFKKEAIQLAWDFLTKEIKLPKEKLYVTVHHSDDEAFNIWNKDIGLDVTHIYRKGDKDNFWEMGEYGPCGPCSEIYYDHGESHAKPGFKPGDGQDILDDDLRYVEIWNLVFMQFEKTPQGQFSLPNPSIDTGMGLERLTAILQGKYWNYDTDLFMPIISKLETLSGKKYSDPKFTNSFRVVADHIRSSTMLITDGAIPSNEGRGYVLRRIIRRAVRHLKVLEAKDGTFAELVPAVFEILGHEYPQNQQNESLAKKFIGLEEKKFRETLDNGLKFLEDAIKTNSSNNTLNGESAFKLYDTYGFPLDLTEIILKEKGMKLDHAGFETAMEKRKTDSRKSWKSGSSIDNSIFNSSKEKNGATNFTGYETLESNAKLLEIIDLSDSKGLIFDTTPFYAESGGQIGDVGHILEDGIKLANIIDTQKPVDGLHVHISKDADALEVGKTYLLKVDTITRNLTMRNHSATHLLQSALIKVLGDHVKQAGSQVGPDRLRFDFTHPQQMTKDEIRTVENLVNNAIHAALPVNADVMSMDKAMEKGALALFGEKYGDKVRVLSMGSFSTELCGGTHVKNTQEIGVFGVLSEGALSSGVRRIEAVTSSTALNRLLNRSDILKEIETQVSAKEERTLEKVKDLFEEIKKLKKEKTILLEQIEGMRSQSLFDNVTELSGGVKFKLSEVPEGADLKKLSDIFANKYENGVLVLYSIKDDKFNVIVRTTANSIKANDLLKKALEKAGGRGGGKPEMAQGSGLASMVKGFVTEIQTIVGK
ncbi:MAG: alanine--tRNA ligase [Bdellovibrio sp.]